MSHRDDKITEDSNEILKKHLQLLDEMATTSGAVATVEQSFYEVQKRNPSPESKPSVKEYGNWKNSVLTGKKKSKSTVKENRIYSGPDPRDYSPEGPPPSEAPVYRGDSDDDEYFRGTTDLPKPDVSFGPIDFKRKDFDKEGEVEGDDGAIHKYNTIIVFKADTEQKVTNAIRSFKDFHWGAKVVVKQDELKKTDNNNVIGKLYVLDNHKYGFEKPFKNETTNLSEEDLIINPNSIVKRISGFIPKDHDRTDHEVEMAKSDLYQAYKNAKKIYMLIKNVSEQEGIEGWVQEKIIKANDYLNAVREYLEGKMVQEMTGGVIAGGGVGESVAEGSEDYQEIFQMNTKQGKVGAVVQYKDKRFGFIYGTQLDPRKFDRAREAQQALNAHHDKQGVAEGSEEKDPIWNKGTPMPKDYTCHCGLYVHPSRRNPKAIHASDCPYAKKQDKEQGVAEGHTGVSVRKWANQVRKDHGNDVKFWNRKEGGGAVDSVIAKNSNGEIVGVYNRKTGYPTVFEPKQGMAEGSANGMRLLSKKEEGQRSVKIYKNTEWNEYLVKFYENGKHQIDADYHTDDKEDAMDTADMFLNKVKKTEQSDVTESSHTQTRKLDEKFKSKQQAKLMYAVADDPEVAKKTGVSQKVAKEFIKKSHGQKVKKLPTKVSKSNKK